MTRAGLIGTVIVLAIAGLCIRLGFWQLRRLDQRVARNQVLAARMTFPALQAEQLPADTTGLVYRRLKVGGRFDHDHTIILAGRSFQGVPGVHVLTPVIPERGSSAILVNRGWLPAPDAATVNYDSLRTTVPVSLVGLLLSFPDRRPRVSQGPPGDSGFQRIWFAPDGETIRAQSPYPLAELYVQALPEEGTPAWPRRLPPPALDRGPHLGYAIQWFSFAAIALIGWFILMLRKGELAMGETNNSNGRQSRSMTGRIGGE